MYAGGVKTVLAAGMIMLLLPGFRIAAEESQTPSPPSGVPNCSASGTPGTRLSSTKEH